MKRPVDISQIQELFDVEYDKLIYNLFVVRLNEHGWTHDEFLNRMIDVSERRKREKKLNATIH